MTFYDQDTTHPSSRTDMTNTRTASPVSFRRCFLIGAFAAVAPLSAALAIPPAAQQFQQVTQQQQTRDNLEKSQQQQQLRQGVADTAARATPANPLLQQQVNQAADAQRHRDLATRQSLLDQQRDADQQRLGTQGQPAVTQHGH